MVTPTGMVYLALNVSLPSGMSTKLANLLILEKKRKKKKKKEKKKEKRKKKKAQC